MRWSVIVTTYKRPGMLRQCLDAVLPALPHDGEVLVSDDSPDGEGETVCDRTPDPRVFYHRNPVNLCIVGNVNTAIGRSRGDLIHWCADDDRPTPDFYREMTALPEGAAVGHCQFTNEYPDGLLWSPPLFRVSPGILDPEILVGHWRQANWTHMVATVFRKHTWKALGGFDPAFPLFHDWLFLLQSSQRFRHWYTPRSLARYRVHGDSATAHGESQRAAELARFQALTQGAS